MRDAVQLTQEKIELFCTALVRLERSAGTVEQYRRSLKRLRQELPRGKALTKEGLIAWKKEAEKRSAVSTVNCMIAAINTYVTFMGAPQMKLRRVKSQRRMFSENELTQAEFGALVKQARKEGDEQTTMLLIAMSGSGVRVSEVQFLTVEAACRQMAEVRLKGKTRRVPLSDKLCSSLLEFARKRGICAGPIFLSSRGSVLDRRRIWERMKRLSRRAGVAPEKVHPHALRHLFARTFYEMTRDLTKLADLLGHSSIETTRIYVITSSREHRTLLNRLTGQLNAKKPPRKGGKKRGRT